MGHGGESPQSTSAGVGCLRNTPVYVLGGYQSDFARNWTREGKGLPEIFAEVVQGGLAATGISPDEVEVGHVGNFAAELFSRQGHLGGLFVEADPAFSGLPTSRHEAACASGSMAVLAAAADLEAGRYDLSCVIGVELMRNVPGDLAAGHLGAAAWNPRETDGVRFVWPSVFSELGDEYERRYGLEREHLAALSESSFRNAKRNPNAQTRDWVFTERSFTRDDAANPVVTGRIRKHDCSQITDGGATVFLASETYAKKYAERNHLELADLPFIKGWGHRTARMSWADKLVSAPREGPIFPHVRGAITDAFERAGLDGVGDLQAIETHDCFSTTHYMAIDHFGITAPGKNGDAIENGDVFFGGRIPINPSGGLTGGGHPVGATGVRMLLDAYKQVSQTAGAYQVPGVKNVATLNIGGSATTTACFVVGR